MSTTNKALDDNKGRRGRLRRQAQAAPVESLEVDDDLQDDEDGASERAITPGKGRATPGRRSQAQIEEAQAGNFITRPLRRIVGYFEGVRSEVQKVVWPTREETIRLTRIVLTTTVLSALALGIISLLFNELFSQGLRAPVIFGVVFVLVLGAFLYYLRRSTGRPTSF